MSEEDKSKTRQIHEMEQATAFVATMLPPMLKRFYDNCKSEGFSEEHALRMVLVYLHGSVGGKLSC